MIAITFLMVGAFGASLLAAHTAFELCDRWQKARRLSKESRDRIDRDLSYRKIL